MDDSETFKVIRALTNDTNPNFTIHTDESLRPFVEEAKKRIPYFAAALMAISFGAYGAADRLMALAGGLALNPLDILKKPESKAESDGN